VRCRSTSLLLKTQPETESGGRNPFLYRYSRRSRVVEHKGKESMRAGKKSMEGRLAQGREKLSKGKR
jgi:hypothetical protein